MKKLYIILIMALGLVSCSAPKLYQQGIAKIEKAIEKDPSIKLPTDTTIVTNTVIEIDTVDNEIIKTVTNTIEVIRDTCNFDCDELQTGRQLRFVRKMYKDSLKHTEKMYKLETNRLQDSLTSVIKLNRELTRQLKDANDTAEKLAKEKTKQKKGNWFTRFMGRIWWLLLLIGLVAGLFLKRYVPNIPNPFKKTDS